ncbi:MAG: BACON domain-containing protein [Flavisolibacter sp.]
MARNYLTGIFLYALLLGCNKKNSNNSLAYINSDRSAIEFSARQGRDSIVINSNTDWTISSLPSWLSASKSSGSSGESKIIFSCLNNEDLVSRKAELKINPVSAAINPITVAVDQNGQSPFITCDKTGLNENPLGQKDSLIISSNVSWTISVTSDAGWIKVDKNSGTFGTTKIYIQTVANNSPALNNAVITITASNPDLAPLFIHVGQDINYSIINFYPSTANVGDTIIINGLFPDHPLLTINNLIVPIITSSRTMISFKIPSTTASGKLNLAFDNNFSLNSVSNLIIAPKSGWTTISSAILPGNEPHSFGISFVWDGKIYYGLGTDITQTIYSRNFHIYDPVTNSWTIGPSIPAKMDPRRYASCFILNNKVYIGFGAYSNQSDWWSMDPSNNTWEQLTSYSVAGFGAVAFVNQNKAFAGAPYKDENLSWLDVNANNGVGSWQVTIAGSFPKLLYSSIFTIGNDTYIAGGLLTGVTTNSVYRFNAASNTLNQVASVPVSFMYAPSFSLNGKGYIIVNGSLYQYDPNLNSWSILFTCPNITGTYNAQVINGIAYIWSPNGTIYRLNL